MKRSRIELAIMALVTVLPVAASYLAYYYWPPHGRVNYGELIEARRLPQTSWRTFDGSTLRLSQFEGKWLMLSVDGGGCDANCRDKLYKMRQVRLTQGKDMDRVERLWLIDDGVAPERAVVAAYAGMQIANAKSDPWLAQLPRSRDLHDHIFIIDPLGNLILRYPRNADAEGMKRDMMRLLKVSRIG